MARIRWSAFTAVVLALTLAGGSAAARDPGKAPKDDKHKRVPGELIVKFRPGVTLSKKEQALAAAGLKAKKKLTADGRFELAAGDPDTTELALKQLGSDPRVAYAEPNFVVSAFRTPNDPSFGQLWGLVNNGQTVDGASGALDADIDAELAWDVSTGSSATVVGIIDTGVDFSHPDLAGAQWINQGENCTGCRTNGVDDDGNGYVDDWRGWDFIHEDNDPFDDHGHGTHVAGTIAATGNNGVGVAGINWTGRVAALKFLDWFGSGSVADAVRAVDYATQKGIRITNNSWGGSENSQALLEAIERAGAAGGLYVAAAGNDGVNADQTPMYPAAYTSSAIVSVAASDSRDQFASFSNRGRTSVDLAAPGVGIYSTLPGNSYDWWSGTSMATPHVAGAAALVKAARPGAGSMAIKALLLRTVDAKASLADTATGGRLNVGSAVRCSGTPQLWLDEPSAGFQAIPGEPVQVVALAGVCGEPTATMAATANGTAFTLAARGDGYYSGTFVPTVIGPLTIAVAATAGSATDTGSVAGTVAENFVFSDDTYVWVDATAGGTNTGIRDDDASVTIPLPFAFRFFGASYTSVKASTNGYLVFGSSAASGWSNERLPAAAVPNGIVAPFWDDLRLSTRGAIWYRTVGTAPNRRFVVEWDAVPHYFDVGGATFEAILEESTGDVVFQYQDVDFGDEFVNDGASATVGIEDTTGTVGRTFSVDQASLASYEGAKALRLRYRGGDADPPDSTPPAAPTGLAATAGVRSVSLDWADNSESDLGSYRVYRDGVQVGTPTASAFTDTGLTAGVTYRYRVTAVDSSLNESQPSGEASAVPLAAPVVETFAPDTFTVVAGTRTGGTLASLSADDGNRLALTGKPTAEVVASRTIPSESLQGLQRLKVDFDGQTANGRDTFTLRAYDWAAGAWVTLFGPVTGVTPDRRLSFDLANPARYVSASDEVRVSARGEFRKGSTVRVDLVSFTVEH